MESGKENWTTEGYEQFRTVIPVEGEVDLNGNYIKLNTSENPTNSYKRSCVVVGTVNEVNLKGYSKIYCSYKFETDTSTRILECDITDELHELQDSYYIAYDVDHTKQIYNNNLEYYNAFYIDIGTSKTYINDPETSRKAVNSLVLGPGSANGYSTENHVAYIYSIWLEK